MTIQTLSSSGIVSVKRANCVNTDFAWSNGKTMSPLSNVRPDGMEPELEAGDNTEVPAAATQPPEEVIVFRFAGMHLIAVRRDDIRGEKVVDGHTVLPAQPAEAAAERQAGHTRGRIDAKRRGEAMCLHGRVEVGEGAAGLDNRPAGAWVYLDAFHQREVDHEAVVADCIARNVVPSTPDRDKEVVPAGEPDGLHDIVSRRATGDQRGAAVDHGVPDLAHLVVSLVAGKKYVPAKVRLELIDVCFW